MSSGKSNTVCCCTFSVVNVCPQYILYILIDIADTVPVTFYFTIFAFVHCSLTIRSPSVHRAFSVRSSCVHLSQFCVHGSPFTRVHVNKSFTVRSPCVNLSLTKLSSFIQRSVSIVIRNSEVERSISRSWNEIMIKR